ncbi:fructosamine kinase family protein, partial [Cellulosimicrobium cellulans]|nr:fructosamine kinase family protein [Cellulosimicrobium cellulans]
MSGEHGAAPAVFTKSRATAPAGFFRCEAAGLAWLDVRGGPRVARVLDVGPDHLDLERVPTTAPTREAARAFGRALA